MPPPPPAAALKSPAARLLKAAALLGSRPVVLIVQLCAARGSLALDVRIALNGLALLAAWASPKNCCSRLALGGSFELQTQGPHGPAAQRCASP